MTSAGAETADRMAAAFASIADGTGTAADVRASLKASRKPVESVEVARVTNRRIDGPEGLQSISVRIYHPLGTAEGQLPVLVYFHGGGFVLCDLDSHDSCCRRLANGAGAIVVSVDYRLAPENPFPAAVDDAWAAVQWVSQHAVDLGGDPQRLVVAGDSAGGNLAAVVSMMARDQGSPAIAFQLLIYPVVDQRRKSSAASEYSRSGSALSGDHMRWFTQQYLGAEGDRTDVLASPILGDFTGLPPAHIVTGDKDPLRAEEEQYAELLRGAGVAVTITNYDNMFHGFFNLADQLPIARQATDDVCEILNGVLKCN
ncbi:MAG: alpha/beta hydrolase [Mycobacterium sp.]